MSKQYHSRAYHRYFEGYAERQVLTEGGKLRTERIYVGEYYRQDITDKERLWRRILYTGIYLLTIVLYVLSGSQSSVFNNVWYMLLPISLGLISLILLFVPIMNYLTLSREMEIREYRESQKLKDLSLFSAISMALASLSALTFIIFNNNDEIIKLILCMIGYLLGAAAMFWLNRMEARLKYIKLPAKNKRPDKSSPIKNYSGF